MKQQKDKDPRAELKFALLVCIVCSLFLGFVFEGLRKRRETNEFLDTRKHILKALRPTEMGKKSLASNKVIEIYRAIIQEMAVDSRGRSVKLQIKTPADQFPVYVYHRDGHILAYCFPFQGKGLWSTIEGYIAIEADGETVRGITFSKQEETPGLGSQIEDAWFQEGFLGKKVYDSHRREFTPLDILRGKVLDGLQEDKKAFAVNGITGATMTLDGVEAMLKQWLRVYEPFLRRVKGL